MIVGAPGGTVDEDESDPEEKPDSTQFGGPGLKAEDESNTESSPSETQFGSPGTNDAPAMKAEAEEASHQADSSASANPNSTQFGAPTSENEADARPGPGIDDQPDPSKTRLGKAEDNDGTTGAVPTAGSESDMLSESTSPSQTPPSGTGTQDNPDPTSTGQAQVIDPGPAAADGGSSSDEPHETSTSGTSESASSNFNPFPHADETVKPKKERAIVDSDAGAGESEASEDKYEDEDIELFDDSEKTAPPPEDDDPFEGAFEGEEDRQREPSGSRSTVESSGAVPTVDASNDPGEGGDLLAPDGGTRSDDQSASEHSDDPNSPDHSVEIQSDPLAVDTSSSDSAEASSAQQGTPADDALQAESDSLQGHGGRDEALGARESTDIRARDDVDTFDPGGDEDSTPEIGDSPPSETAPPSQASPPEAARSSGGGESPPGTGARSDSSSSGAAGSNGTDATSPGEAPESPTSEPNQTPSGDVDIVSRGAPPGSSQSEAETSSTSSNPSSSPQSTSTPSNSPSESGETSGDPAGDTPSTRPGPSPSEWQSDGVERIESNAYSGSGARKVANIALIVLLVGNAFLGFVAFRNGGFLDFKKFDQMLAVAFQDGSYTPRKGWTSAAGSTEPAAPSDPIRFKNVFAQRIQLNGDSREESESGESKPSPRLLVIKGQVQNRTDETFDRLRVRGLILDTTGKLLKDRTIPIGGDLAIGELQSLERLDEVDALLSEPSGELQPHQARPFTIVFRQLPDELQNGKDVHYSVERVEDSDAPGDSSSAQ